MYSWGILILRFVTFISFTIHTYTHTDTHTCIYILVTPPFSLFYSLLFLSCARILLTFPTLPSGGRFSTPFVTHAKWGQHEFVSFCFFLRWNQLNCNHHKSPTNWLGVVAMWNVAQVNRRERKKRATSSRENMPSRRRYGWLVEKRFPNERCRLMRKTKMVDDRKRNTFFVRGKHDRRKLRRSLEFLQILSWKCSKILLRQSKEYIYIYI